MTSVIVKYEKILGELSFLAHPRMKDDKVKWNRRYKEQIFNWLILNGVPLTNDLKSDFNALKDKLIEKY